MKLVIRHIGVFVFFISFAGTSSASEGLYTFGPSNFQNKIQTSSSIVPNRTDGIGGQLSTATNGNGYLIIWTEGPYSSELWGARISSNGNTLDPDGFLIHKGGFHRFPKIAYGKEKFLIVWQEYEGSWGRSKVKGIILDFNKNILVNHDFKPTYPANATVQSVKYTGERAVYSDGIFIFPDIQHHYNAYQEVDPLSSFDAPDVSYNGSNFVISSGGYIRLIDPMSGKIVREGSINLNNQVYPLGKPITKYVMQCAYWSTLSCGTSGQCLLSCVNRTAESDPGFTNLHSRSLHFSGNKINLGVDTIISGSAQAPYADLVSSTDGKGGYMIVWNDLTYTPKNFKYNYYPYTSDLFAANLRVDNGQITIIKKFPLYMKKQYDDYYPHIDYDGKNYVVIWNSLGTNFKVSWSTNDPVILQNYLEIWDQTEFYDYISEDAYNEAMKPLTCMSDYSLLGHYISANGSILDSFGILNTNYNEAIVGGRHKFARNSGLLFYVWENIFYSNNQHNSGLRAFPLNQSYYKIKTPDSTIPSPNKPNPNKFWQTIPRPSN